MFKKNSERNGYTGFNEFQYVDKSNDDIFNYLKIEHFKANSIYIEASTIDEEIFLKEYNKLLKFGCKSEIVFENGEFATNLNYYYDVSETNKIISQLESGEYSDSRTLINWLKIAVKDYNGFYYLSV